MKRRIVSSVLTLVIVLSSFMCLSGITTSVSAATTNQQHIIDRANYMFDSTWTCKKTVQGWRGTFYAGGTYRVPYGQPVYAGKYVGFGISVSDFLNATTNPNNIFYTGRGHCGGTTSPYYATDCSAFVSYCWGTARNTTYSIPSVSSYKGMATAANAQNLQLGDCLNSNSVGHVVLVTGLKYSNGRVSEIEITEQTPPQLKRSYYTPSSLGAKYGGYYGIYRYYGNVPSAPGGYTKAFSLDASNAQNIGDDFYARITNSNAGKDLTCQGGNDGDNVCIESMRNFADQQYWHFIRQSDNSYKIVNTKYNKCLDVYGGKGDAGSNVGIYSSNDSNAQRWYILKSGDKYVLRPKCSSTVVLDVAGAGTASGTNVMTWTYNGCGAQLYTIDKFDFNKFQLMKTTVFDAKYYADHNSDLKGYWGYDANLLYTHFIYHGIDEGRQASPIFSINNYINENSDLKSQYSNNKLGALVHFYSYGMNETRYTANRDNLGDNFYAKITNTNANLNLTYNSKASVVLAKDSSAFSQIWHFVRQGDGSYKIDNKLSGNCIDVYNGSRNMGADVITYASNNGDNQRWFLHKAADGGYYFRAKIASTCVLDVENGSKAENANVRNWCYNGSSAQSFKVNKVDISNMVSKPVVTDAKITESSGRGYTVTGKATAEAGISKVEVKTWTESNGQDDVFVGKATMNGNTFTYKVLGMDHSFESGKYISEIIAYDSVGNKVSTTVNVSLPGGYALGSPVSLGDDFYARIGYSNSSLYLSANSEGKNVIVDTKGAKEEQVWHFVRQTDGTYKIINKKNNKALDIDNGNVSSKDGVNAGLWNSHNGTNQRFNIYKVSGGYVFRTVCTTKHVLDVNAASKTAGANVQIWTYNASDAQIFSVDKVTDSQLGANPINIGDDFYAKIVNVNANLNLTLASDNTNVVTGKSENSQAQIWHFVRQSNGSYKIINNKNNKVLDIANGLASSNAGANVEVWDSLNQNNQRFNIFEIDGAYVIKPLSSSTCVLDVSASSKEAGANIQLWTYLGGGAQKFKINKVSDTVIGGSIENLGNDFYAKITNVNANLNLTLASDNSNVVLGKIDLAQEQVWHFVRQSNGSYKIINNKNNKVLDVANGLVSSKAGTNVGVWDSLNQNNQRWNIYNVDGNYVFKPLSSTDCVLDVNASGKEPGANIQLWTYNGCGAQKYKITKVTDTYIGGTLADIGTNFTAKITNTKANLNLSLDGNDRSVITYNNSTSNAQQWYFTRQSDGSYKIKNCKTGKYLDAANGVVDSRDGTDIIIYAQGNGANQRWNIYQVESGYVLKPQCSTKYVMDVENGSTAPLANVRLWGYNGSTAQSFKINKIGDTQIGSSVADLGTNFTAKITNNKARLNLSLDGNDRSVITYNDSSSAAQQWYFMRQSDGSYKIKNCKTGKFLDAANGVVDSRDGTDIIIYSEGNGANQRWNIFAVDGGYVFKPQCSSKYVMDVENGSTAPLANVRLWTYNSSTAQTFTINKLNASSSAPSTSSGNMEVIRKIIYAVETGGQVYGQADYTNFTEAYTNSSTEYAITIGAGQWYATEAKTLLNTIRSRDPGLFASLDTAGIAYDLDHSNWSTYKLSKTSAKAKCIQKIIGSSVGRSCQDYLVEAQMATYMKEAANLGVTDIDAQMMCANIRHQGGYGALTRVLGKTKKPYTLDNIYAALQTDTGNQVGAYRSRQKMVYNSLKTYL